MEQIPKPIEPDGMFTGLNIKAIVLGVIADIAATFILSMILTIVLIIKQYGADIPDDAVDKILESDSSLYLYLILGLACTTFGGFIAAKKAGSFAIRHGGWVGAGSLITGVLMEVLLDQNQVYPDWYMYISMGGIIPAGILGGYLSIFFSRAE